MYNIKPGSLVGRYVDLDSERSVKKLTYQYWIIRAYIEVEKLRGKRLKMNRSSKYHYILISNDKKSNHEAEAYYTHEKLIELINQGRVKLIDNGIDRALKVINK